MTTLVIEIHDAGLLAAGEDGPVGNPSPGYALFDGDRLLTGAAALERAREKPRWVHHRFWQELDTEPLGRPFPRDLSAADLAHAHLSEFWGAVKGGVASVLFAVPGTFTDRQLGLLLGIAGACGLPVHGLVDTAVAAAHGHRGQKLLHLDFHLHRAVLTELSANVPPPGAHDPRVTAVRRRVEVAEDAGLVALQDAWARRIAELFVHATRYDPLHSAEVEQALYRALPEWLARLRTEEVLEVTLGPAGRERSIELTRPDVVAAADDFYEGLRELVISAKRAGEGATLLLAHRAAELPGLERRLAGLRGVTPVRLEAGAAAAGALAARDQIVPERAGDAGGADPAAEPLPFVVRLTYACEAPSEPAAPRPELSEARARPQPTHLVYEGLAYPITERDFVLGSALGGEPGLELEGVAPEHCRVVHRDGRVWVEDHGGSSLNGEPVAGSAPVEAGDRLRLGEAGVEVLFVAEVDSAPPRPSGAR